MKKFRRENSAKRLLQKTTSCSSGFESIRVKEDGSLEFSLLIENLFGFFVVAGK